MLPNNKFYQRLTLFRKLGSCHILRQHFSAGGGGGGGEPVLIFADEGGGGAEQC